MSGQRRQLAGLSGSRALCSSNVISWLTQKAERARKKCENRRCHVAHSAARRKTLDADNTMVLCADALVKFGVKIHTWYFIYICSSFARSAPPFCCVSHFSRGISFTLACYNNRANWTFLSHSGARNKSKPEIFSVSINRPPLRRTHDTKIMVAEFPVRAH